MTSLVRKYFGGVALCATGAAPPTRLEALQQDGSTRGSVIERRTVNLTKNKKRPSKSSAEVQQGGMKMMRNLALHLMSAEYVIAL